MVLTEAVVAAFVLLRNGTVWVARKLGADERGEGVISAAIAVLIMAFLGALMWVGFRSIWGESETNIRNQTNQIGTDSGE